MLGLLTASFLLGDAACFEAPGGGNPRSGTMGRKTKQYHAGQSAGRGVLKALNGHRENAFARIFSTLP